MTWRNRIHGLVFTVVILGALALASGAGWVELAFRGR